MVDLEYVKRRKRKKAAAIISAVASVGLAVFIIVSFLGQRVGTYTVGLYNNDIQLTLSEHSTFEERSTFLRVDDIAKLGSYCYQSFKTKGQLDLDAINSEFTTYKDFAEKDDDGNVTSCPFFKYTFFVKNIGSKTAKYNMNLNIIENTPDRLTGKYLDEVLRVALLEDGDVDNMTVYAMKSIDNTHRSEEQPDVETDAEYICGPSFTYKYAGMAEKFLSADKVGIHKVTDFKANEVHQYTLIYWIEGDDHECEDPFPREAKIRLGVEINAYEN